MSEISREQERDEKKRIRSGMRLSVVAIVAALILAPVSLLLIHLCWLPAVAVLLASAGYVRAAGSVTRQHRKRRRGAMLAGLIALVISLGLAVGCTVIWLQYPWAVDDAVVWVMDALTDGDWSATRYGGGIDEPVGYGMGQNAGPYAQGYTSEGYYNEYGELVPYEEAEDVTVGEDETGG